MKGIKLTPFLLFVILLVVLILAMLFGSTSKPILENMETDGYANTSTWNPVLSNSIQSYSSGTQLHDIVSIKDGENGIYYDPNNGNIIISDNLVSDTYTLLTRDSMGVPVIVTTSTDTKTSISNTVNLTTAPWTYVANQLSVLYCPYKANTFIIVINNSDNTIVQIFKSSKGISNSLIPINSSTGVTNTIEASQYAQLGQQVKEQITINGKNVDTTKVANNVYYSDTLGIAVGSPGNVFDVSDDFKTSVSRQNTDTILVISVLLDEASLLSVIITKEPSTNVYKVASSNFIKHSFNDGNPNDSFSLTVETPDGNAPGSGSGDGSGSGSGDGSGDGSGNGSGNGKSCNSQYYAKPSYICPNSNNSSGSDDNNGSCNNGDYIRKSEIVPPVCPGCPPCAPASCNLSINSDGEMVDCTGKKYEPEGGILGASPAAFDGIGSTLSSAVSGVAGVAETGLSETGDVLQTGLSETGDVLKTGIGVLAPTVDNTVDTAGNVLEKGLDTAGGAFDKTLSTAGDALETTVDGAGNIVGELGDTVGDIASGIGEGVGGLGTGASDLVQGVSSDVAGLGNNMIDSTTGLLKSTGSGIMELSQQQQQQMQQQMQQGNPMQQGYMQQGYMQQGNPMQQGYPMQQGNPMQQGMGYSYPQTCPRGGSNFVPITNDFSQFS